MATNGEKLSLPALTAMVVGSMVGAGIFNLPGRFATATGPFGAIIAWLIAGTGMYMLARVFQALAEKRPDIDSGVFAYAKAGFVDQKAVTGLAEEMAGRLRVKTPNLAERVENLSGGNQQKLLIARWLLTKPRILILDEPTRGIDVGAKSEIHRLITNLAAEGVAVLMISSELPEVLGMSDRIMVMHEGHVSGFLTRDEADQVKIMELAAR